MTIIKNKIAYYSTMIYSFISIFICNSLTPYMSDDFKQIQLEQERSSFTELLSYWWEHYMTINGRSNTHFVLRFVLEQDVWVFNLLNSLFFLGLIQLIYWNVRKRNKYDVKLYIFITALMWLSAVEFGQTILWKTGAVNYLWATTLIMGFFTLYRMVDEKWSVIQKKSWILVALGIVGILAGWCNENTSGGILLYVGIHTVCSLYKNRKLFAHQVVSIVSLMVGLMCMVLAPGNWVRLDRVEDSHSGLLALLSRVLQITTAVETYFYWLFLLLLVIGIIVFMQKGLRNELIDMMILMVASLATCYILFAIPTPMNRVYFGAGIFLIMACSQGFQLLCECDMWSRILQYFLVCGLAVTFAFTYVEASSQLLRIYLQHEEREISIFQQAEEGVKTVVVTPYEEFYRTKYSYIHDSDITDNEKYWSNWLMCQYYQVDGIVIEDESID